MSLQLDLYLSLKKNLDFIIQSLIQKDVFHEDTSLTDIQRNDKNLSNVLEEIETAICKREVMNNDLEKLTEDAKIFKRRGEMYHEKKMYQKAVHEYSKSFCCLPYDVHNKCRRLDSDVTFADASITLNCDTQMAERLESCRNLIVATLGERAEMLRILGHHELALRDIEEALSFQPSKEVCSSVLQTHKLCLSEMRRQRRSQSPRRSPPVANSIHQSIASASDLMKVNYSTAKGRYLEANGDIRAGDVLIVEKPFSSVLLPEFYHSHCYHCIKPLIAPIPCFSCQDVLFCSKECQTKAYSSYHNIECKIWPVIQMVDSFAHLSIRILLTAKPEELLVVLEKEKNSNNNASNIHGYTDTEYKHNYKAVYNLVTNSESQSRASRVTNTLISSIISRFLSSPTAVSNCELRSKDIPPKKQQRSSIRLSSSSPALLNGRECSKENLNSLADAFSAHNEKEKNTNGKKLGLSRSSISLQSESLRSDAVLTMKKDLSGSQNRRRSCSDYEENMFCGFYQTVLSEDQVKKLILRHLQQIACNVHTVTTLTLVEEQGDSNPAISEMLFGKQEYSLRKEQRQIAIALYPTASLLNHACDPDVIVSFTDDELIMRATHNISKGDEITHCYVPHVGRMQRAARQRMLQKRYYFVCSCRACRRDEERERRQLLSLQLQCPECRDVAKVDYINDAYVARCCSKDCNKMSNVESQLEQIQYSRELFLDAVDFFKSGDIKKSLTILQQVMKRRSSVLQSKDKLVAEVHDALSRCYEVLREWEFASYHCSMNLDSIAQQYGEKSSECAHVVAKLARFLYNGKLFDKAGNVIERGIKLLLLHYGDDYPAVKELRKMKECVQNFSTPVSQFAV